MKDATYGHMFAALRTVPSYVRSLPSDDLVLYIMHVAGVGLCAPFFRRSECLTRQLQLSRSESNTEYVSKPSISVIVPEEVIGLVILVLIVFVVVVEAWVIFVSGVSVGLALATTISAEWHL
jgi:hypothetical protein